jgi:hypothetical protein
MGETVGSASAVGRERTTKGAISRTREPLLSSPGAARTAAYADEQLDRFFAALRRMYVDLGPDAIG